MIWNIRFHLLFAALFILCLSSLTDSIHAQNIFSIENAHYPVGTTEITVNIALANEDAFWGFLFDVTDTPDVLNGISVSSILGEQGFEIYGNNVDVMYRVILFTMSIDTIPPGPQRIVASIVYTVEAYFEGIITLDFDQVQMIDEDANLMPTVTSQGYITIGGTGVSEDASEETFSPETFTLSQNTPNPFNAQTAISFGLPEAGRVTMTIYNTLGREVETLINTNMNPGQHTIFWNSRNNPSGIYFYTLKTDGFQETKRMLLVR